MIKLNTFITGITKNIGSTSVSAPKNVAKIIDTADVGDVFIKQGVTPIEVKQCAKDFRNGIIKPFSDWQSADQFEKSSNVARKLFSPFTKAIKGYSKEDAQYFTKLAFGEDTVDAITAASKRNPDVKLFKDTLEERLGVSIGDAINIKKP